MALRKKKLKEEEKLLRKEEKSEYIRDNPLAMDEQEILEYWNSKGIVNHRLDSITIMRALPAALKRYTKDEILYSINNYATVYFDDDYKPFVGYNRYTWTLANFLHGDRSQPIEDFMSDGQKWINYCRFKDKQKLIWKPEPELQAPVFSLPEASAIEALYAACIAALKAMPYKDYIKTDHWQHFRKEALKHFNATCQLCGANDTTLDVHHKTYINRGRETFNDVIVLCRHCHDLYHHNKDQCTCSRCSGEEGEHEIVMEILTEQPTSQIKKGTSNAMYFANLLTR